MLVNSLAIRGFPITYRIKSVEHAHKIVLPAQVIYLINVFHVLRDLNFTSPTNAFQPVLTVSLIILEFAKLVMEHASSVTKVDYQDAPIATELSTFT